MTHKSLPYFCAGPIIKGFGRGSSEIGCPTGKKQFFIVFVQQFHVYFPYCFIANLPLDVVKNLPEDLGAGIYFGWANVDNGDVHKAVLSIGWNPFYDNKEKSMVCIWFINLLVPKCMPYLSRSNRVVITFQVDVSTFHFLNAFYWFLSLI